MFKICPGSAACKTVWPIPRFVVFCTIISCTSISFAVAGLFTNSWKIVETRNGETVNYGLQKFCRSNGCNAYPQYGSISDKFDVILIMLIASLFPLVAISLHIIVVSIIARDHIKSRMHCYALFQATAGILQTIAVAIFSTETSNLEEAEFGFSFYFVCLSIFFGIINCSFSIFCITKSSVTPVASLLE